MKPAILLIDHGSRRDEANAQLERIAALVRERDPDRRVYTAHMEIAPPTVAEALDRCAADGVDEVVVHPYFLGPGRHTREDIPRLVTDAARRHPGLRLRISEPLGAHPAIVDAILERVERTRS